MNMKNIFWLSLPLIIALAALKLFFSGSIVINGLLGIFLIANIVAILSFKFTGKIIKAARLFFVLNLATILLLSAYAYFSGENSIFNKLIKNLGIYLSFIHFFLVIYTIIKLKINK